MKHLLLLAVTFWIAASADAQHMLGISPSNYAGIHGLNVNPASIADSRLGFSLLLSSVDVNVSNNYVRYNGPSSLIKLLKNGNEFESDYLEVIDNNNLKFFTSSIDYRGPSFMLTLSPKHSIALTTRVRGALQADNISENIAELIKTGGVSDELLDRVSENNRFSLNANMQAELGLSYARVLLNEDVHFLKGGLTVKKLTGLYSAHLINDNTKFQLVERADATDPAVVNNVIEIQEINARYGYMNDELISDVTPEAVLGWFTNGDAPGKGWGADIGFAYEYRPDTDQYRKSIAGVEHINHRKNKYKLRFGFSLMDLGGIRYKNPAYTRGYKINATDKEINTRDFENAEDTEGYAAVINNSLGIRAADRLTSFTSGLPTTLQANLDYSLAGPLYLNAHLVQNLRGQDAIAMRRNSLIALTPRLELKSLELAFPVSLYNNYSAFGLGAMVKLGGFFIGSDNLNMLLNTGNQTGTNIYMGFSIPNIGRRSTEKMKDIRRGTDHLPTNR